LGLALKMVIKKTMNFCLEPILDRYKKREENNRLKDWRREN
jgi:hypothetical protein